MDNNDKHFGAMWYSASDSQLRVICDEVVHWDSSKDNYRFFSTIPESVDFIQYARSATGVRSKVVTTRVGVGAHKTCYAATASKIKTPALSCNGTGVTVVSELGAKKYCFSVPTGRLLVRYAGHVFVSGNCFNIRRKRGSGTPSLHSWGVAIDVNAAWNGFGKTPKLSSQFVKCFTSNGFDWGGEWGVPDGMHFQLKRDL
jgi:hypothetical protein